MGIPPTCLVGHGGLLLLHHPRAAISQSSQRQRLFTISGDLLSTTILSNGSLYDKPNPPKNTVLTTGLYHERITHFSGQLAIYTYPCTVLSSFHCCMVVPTVMPQHVDAGADKYLQNIHILTIFLKTHLIFWTVVKAVS